MKQGLRLTQLLGGKFVLTAVFLLTAITAWAQGTQTFNASGNFTVPAGVTSITIECWGAGGGAASGSSAAGGGGGGAYTRGTITGLTEGNLVTITVPSTASAGSSGSFARAQFGATTITANGGNAGSARTGGNGGAASTVGGAILASFKGGDGGDARASSGGSNNEAGGGGGGSATTTAAGGDGANGGSSTTTATAGGTGTGAGGVGAAADGNPGAGAGNTPGGGGGGRGEGSSTSQAGAAGRVVVSWVPGYKAQFTAMNLGSTNWCPGETRTVTVTVTNTGQATWTNSNPQVRIGATWSGDGSYPFRVDANNLAPGASQTYSLSVTAPTTAGTSTLIFDVVKETDCWFAWNSGNCGPGNSVYTSANQTILSPPANRTVAAAATTICSGTSTNITVASSTTGVNYQLRNNADNSLIGSPVAGTGGTINLPTGVLTTTTTFNVLATTVSNGCTAQMTNTPTVTVNQPSTNPNDATATLTTICAGQSTQLTLNGGGGGTGQTIRWFTGSCGGTSVGTGNSLSVSPTTTTTYYGRYETGTPCSQNTSCASVIVNVNSNPAASVTFTETSGLTNNDGTICNGDAVTLNGNPSSGVTYLWSNGATANNAVTPASTTAYSVTVTNTVTNCSASANGTVTVNQPPVNRTVAATATNLCSGSSTNITVASSTTGVNYQLRNDANNANIGSPVAGNNGTINLSTGALTATTTFNVLATTTSTGCTSQMANTPTVTVNQRSANPASATATATTICAGESTTLTLNGGGGGDVETVRWYTSSCGSTLAGTGVSLTVSPTTTTTYYGRYENGSPCSSNTTCSQVTINVNQLPANKTVAAAASTICSGTGTNITVAASTTGVNYQLRNDANDANIGSPVAGTGGTINLPTGNLTATTTFNVLATTVSSGCSLQMSVTPTVTVNQPAGNPTDATASQPTICAGQSTQLTLNGGGGGTGQTIRWFTGSCGGTSVGTGNNLSVSPTTTTTYYGRYETGTPCSQNTTCASVIINVNSNPAASVTFTETSGLTNNDGTICNGDAVTLNGNPSSGVTYLWSNGATANNAVTPASTTAYSVTVTNTVTNCSASANGTVTVNQPPVNRTVAATTTTIFIGSSTNITVAGSTTGVNYQLRNDANNANIGSPVAGNNGTINLPTGALSSNTTFNVLATVASTGCSMQMSATPTVNVIPVGTGYFRSNVTTGNWNVAGNWQMSADNVNWSTSTTVPDNNALGITVQSGHTITVTAAATASNLTITGTLTMSGSNSMAVNGNWTKNGTFNANSSTITFNGSSAQTIGGSSTSTFNNLTINTPSASTVVNSTRAFTAANVNVTQGNLTLSATDANHTVTNDLNVAANGTLTHSVDWNASSRLLSVGGNLSVDGMFAYTVRSHVQMNGTNKTIKTGSLPGSSLSILTLTNTSGTINANGNLVVDDNFWAAFGVAGGTFATNGQSVTANGGMFGNGGTINVNGGSLSVSGGLFVGTTGLAGILNVSSGSLTTDGITIADGTRAGTVNYSGGTIDAGNVTLNNNGSFIFTNGTTVNVSGHWTRNTGSSVSTTANINFNGPGAHNLNGTSTSQTFNNINVNKPGGSLTVGGNTTTLSANNITLTAGTFAAGTATNINVAGDWNTITGTFTPGTQRVTFNGSAAQNILGTAPTFYNITMNNTAGLSLSVDATITNTLTFSNGKITTGANVLTITNTSASSVSGAAAGRYVYGNLEKRINNGTSVTQVFEVGDATTYAPVNLSFSGTVSGSGTITAFTVDGDHPNVNTSTINESESVARYWSLTNNGVTGFSSYSPTFNFVAGDVDAGASTGSFIVGRYAGTWTYPTVGSRTSTSTQATGLTAFGAFMVGEGGAGVPTMNTQPANQQVCVGGSTSFTTVANSVPGSSVQWQINTGSGFNNLTVASPYSVNTTVGATTTSSTLTINPAAAGLTGYLYRAIFTNTKGSVTSNQASLTVNPLPTVFNVGGSGSVCPSGSTNITLSGSTTGVNYQLRNDANNANVGSAVAGTGAAINLPTGSLTAATTFNVLATVAATGCNVEMNGTANITIATIPLATVTNSSQTICSGNSFTTMALGTSNSVAGTTFAWTRDNTGSVTGIPASGSGNITSAALTNTTGSAVTVTFTITPTGPAPTFCVGTPVTATVLVNALPSVSVTPSPATICLNGSSVLTAINTGGITDRTYSASSGTINVSIPDESNSAYTYPTLTLSGSSATLNSSDIIQVTVNINHSEDDELDVFLVDPSGTRAMLLTSDNGGSSNNYTNTVFRTDASTSITSGSAPFTGTFRPEGSITTAPDRSGAENGQNYNSVVPANSLNGASIDGTWSLRAFDDNNDGTGTVVSWSLSIIKSGDYTTVINGPANIGSVSYAGANNNTATATVTPTASGTQVYTITTTDAIGCSNSTTANVVVNPLPAVSVATIETSGGTNDDGTICAGASVTLVASPTSGMTYAWASPVGGTGNNKSVSPATTTNYTVTVTNSVTSCSATAGATVTLPLPSASITATETSGTNNNDDNICLNNSAVLTANPTSGMTYAWAAPISASGNGKTVSPITTTTYNVTVTHPATGCNLTAAKTITVNPLPTPVITNNYCYGGGNVQLTSNAASSYAWSTGGTTQSVLVDQAGTYFVTVTNGFGCTAEDFTTVAIELTTNGDFSAGATGFVTGYGNNQSNNGLVPEGLYAVGTNANTHHTGFWGRDHTTGTGNFMIVNGATQAQQPIVWQQTVTIQPNTIYYFSAWAMSVNQSGNYAQLQFNVNGTSVGTIANLGPGPGNSTQANANNYWQRFYGTWNSGSSTSAVISIVDMQTIAGGNDFALDDISCSTLSTVSLGSTASSNGPVCIGNAINLFANRVGGMSPISYSWSGPNSFASTDQDPILASATNAMAGNYSVTITDGYGCTAGSTVNVVINTPPTVEAGGPNAVCQSSTPAAITLSGASFGGGATTAAWSITSGGGTLSSTSHSSTPATRTYTPPANFNGTVTLTLTTNFPGGCVAATDTRTIVVNSLPTATASSNSPVCTNDVLNLSGGTAGLTTYSWSGPNSFTSTNQNPSISNPTTAAAGTYRITVTNSNGCTATATTSVAVNTAPTVNAAGPSVTCQSGTPATLTLTGATRGGGSATAAWSITSGGGTLSSTAQTATPASVTYTPAPNFTGTAVLTLTTNALAGCAPATATRDIVVNPLPVPSIAITETSGINNNDATSCSGDQVTLTASPATGMNYAWSHSLPGNVNVQNPTPASTTTYSVTVTNQTTSCSAVASNTVNVTPYPVAYNVVGGACIPAIIGLSNSEPGISYQLVRDGNINMGSPIIGTGSAINFPNQTVDGIYGIVATNTTTGCVRNMTGVATINFCTSTWIGVTDTNWHVQTNWNPAAVPNNCYVNVIIPFGTPFQPNINSYDINVRNMNIASNVTLGLAGRNLNVCGDWAGGSGANAAVVGTGTVYINTSTSAPQTITGNTKFDVLQLINSQGVSLVSPANVSISRGLHLQTGNFNVSAGTLQLLSASGSNNSYIDDFTPGYTGTITGNVVAHRYIPVSGRNQHFMSSPVNSPSFSQMDASGPNGAYVIPTADCDETRSSYGSPYGSAYMYNDGYRGPGACMLGNWMVKSQGNMDNGRGYSIYQVGDTTMSLTGAANTGNLQVGNLNNSGYPTVNTLQGQPIESGWNLVGNPYPSSLDLTVDRSTDGFQNQVQIWKTTGDYTGSWQPAVINGSSGQAVIPPFQAFMVRVVPGSLGLHNYSFYQSERTRVTNQPFYRTQSESALTLELDHNGRKDLTRVEFNPSATTNFDDAYDANKYNGSPGRPTLYTTMNTNEWYAINTLPSLQQTTTVPVGLRPEVDGTMTLNPQGLQSFDATSYIFLEDKKTNTWHNVRDGGYTFSTKKTDNQSRFVLHFTPPARILTSDASCDGDGMINIEQPGNATWNYTLKDQSNNTVSSGTLNQANPVNVAANTGVYMLSLTDNNGYTVLKSIQVGGSQPVVANFTTTSNTVQAQETVSFTSTTADAASYTWNFGDGATANGPTVAHTYNTEGVYTASLTVANAAGCLSTSTQTINVTSRAITGISTINTGNLEIWSADNKVYIDFSKQPKVEAEIEMYNVLGQMIATEKFGRSVIYSKEIPNLEAAYLVVRVKNDDKLTTKKVFITNSK